MSTIRKVQNFLTIRGFDPGGVDGEDGPLTEYAWDSFEAICALPVTIPVPENALEKILARAISDVGVLETYDDAGTDHGNLGCADAVTRILHDELGFSLPKTLSTAELFDELKAAGWTTIDLYTPGAVIVSPTGSSMHGHTGIVGNNGDIYSNSSATGKWSKNWTVARWVNYYARCGSYAFVPPVATPDLPDNSSKGFQALGSDTPIRGDFVILPSKVSSLCVGSFAPYSIYADAIVQDCQNYGLNPLFVLANLINQGVNPAYKNPWGISTDSYPYGIPNGRIKNGPRRFSDSDWRLAFDRQFNVVANSSSYKNAHTIAQWALIDAPPGASNDPYNTNASEGVDVGNIYNRLVKSL